MDYKRLGANIRRLRREKCITQAQLAHSVGLSTAFIGHIERGTRKASIETIVQICDELNASVDVMLGRIRPRPRLVYRIVYDDMPAKAPAEPAQSSVDECDQPQ